MSIISISGKLNSGKDTVGKIIQSIIECKKNNNLKNVVAHTLSYLNNYGLSDRPELITKLYFNNNWEIKKFADKLKDIVCLLIGCTREQLEDPEFKEKELGEEWKIYYANKQQRIFTNREDVLDFHGEFIKVKEEILTPRKLLQLFGTQIGRELIHPQIWCNSLFSDYKKYKYAEAANGEVKNKPLYKLPNWIITDMRFPNEVKAVKDRGGITIRVNRLTELRYPELWIRFQSQNKIDSWDDYLKSIEKFDKVYHSSETSLDNTEFDYVIDNNSDIPSLIEKVKEILIKEKII